MSEDNNKRVFFSSSKSRKKEVRQKPWLAVPLALLVLLMGTALFFTVKYALGKWGGSGTDPAVTTTVPSGESTKAAQTTTAPKESTKAAQTTTAPKESTKASQTTAATKESTTAAKETTTAARETTKAPESTTEAPATQPASGDFHLYTAAEVLPVPDNINRNFFDDVNASDASGGWWFGSRVRNLETGEVQVGYDRSASTLDTLAKYDAIYRKNEDQKVCYLTFDCGYEYGYTGAILDALRNKGAKAIFFIAGDFVNDPQNKDLLLRMYNEGHLIGCHTDHHPVMPTVSDEQFVEEINNLQIKVNNMLGLEYQIRYYRPPQGSTCERDLYLAKKMGLTTVLWSYAYADYNVNNQMEVPAALEKAKKGLHDGCVYLLHAVSSTNAAMLEDLIDYIWQAGYAIRRLDQ